MSDKRLHLPNGPLTVTVLSWGFNFIAIKLLYREVPPAAVGLMRYFLMFAALVGLSVALKEKLKFPPATRWKVWLQGFLSMGVYMVLFLEGLKRVSGAECSILLNTAPIFTTLFAVMAKQEKFRWAVIAGAVCAFSGVTLVVLGSNQSAAGPSGQDHFWGVVMVIASAIVWAWSAVISKPLTAQMSPLKMLTLSMPAAMIVLLPYGWAQTASVDWTSVSVTSWALLGHVTLLAGVGGFIGFYLGVRKIGAAGAMLYQYFVPPLAATFEWLVLGKSLGAIQFAGLAVVIVGVSIASAARQKDNRTTESVDGK